MVNGCQLGRVASGARREGAVLSRHSPLFPKMEIRRGSTKKESAVPWSVPARPLNGALGAWGVGGCSLPRGTLREEVE